MTPYSRAFALGEATISVINVGDLILKLAEEMNVPESEWRPHYAALFEQAAPFPSQCIHIALPGASVLVDASNYTAFAPPGSPYLPPNYQPPPDLAAQLVERGIRPEDITHLVITHAHFDHYAGVSTERDGRYAPSFPNARCFLGKADWEHPETQEALQDPTSMDSRTLGVLRSEGLLQLIEGDRDLAPAIRIIAAPGESPGHQLVRVHSQGQTLYCLGDLYHSTIEVEQPTWMSTWANPETNLASRRALVQAALAENALLIAAHIPNVGFLERTAGGVHWTEVQRRLVSGC